MEEEGTGGEGQARRVGVAGRVSSYNDVVSLSSACFYRRKVGKSIHRDLEIARLSSKDPRPRTKISTPLLSF